MDRDKIGIGLGALLFGVHQYHAFISHFDLLGGTVQPFPDRDLEVWVVSIILVAFGSGAVAFLILSKLVLQSLVMVVG